VARLVAPDRGVRGVDVETPRGTVSYSQDRQGIINVANPSHAKQMISEGFFEASLMGATTNGNNLGYTCNECGFGSWFRKCSRCGFESTSPSRDGE